MECSEHAAQQERAIRQRPGICRKNPPMGTRVILCWIEQCRLAMDPLTSDNPSRKGNGDQKLLIQSSAALKATKTLWLSLGRVRVCRSPRQRVKNIRTRTYKATISKPISHRLGRRDTEVALNRCPEASRVKVSTCQREGTGANFFRREWPRQNRFADTWGQLAIKYTVQRRRSDSRSSKASTPVGPLSGYILRLGPSRPKVNGYQREPVRWGSRGKRRHLAF